MVVFFHIQRKYKLFEFNHPGASPRVVFVYLSVALTTGERQQKSACLSKGGDMQSIPEELGALSLEGELDGSLYIPDESSQPL